MKFESEVLIPLVQIKLPAESSASGCASGVLIPLVQIKPTPRPLRISSYNRFNPTCSDKTTVNDRKFSP